VRGALREGEELGALDALASVVRDGASRDTASRVELLCGALQGEPELAAEIGEVLRRQLVLLRVGPALTESGITPDVAFLAELGSRLVRRVLPDLEDPEDLRTVVRRLFRGRDDHLRVASVPEEIWVRLLGTLGITAEAVPGIDPELEAAIRTLAHHIGSLGLDPEFTRRRPGLENPDSPFLALTDRVLVWLRSLDGEAEVDNPRLLEESLATVQRCRAEVEHLRATKHEHGTSLGLTGLTFRLLQLLDRLELLLHLTEAEQREFQASAVRLFREIVHAERTRNHLLPHLKSRVDLLAFQVVEHAAKKGSKYITTTRADYWKFFLASLGGGGIVALFSLFKTIAGKWELPLGIEALVYGLNYSLCFILIYLTGSALATKQPAMTANTIARALDGPNQGRMEELGSLVVRVWRSQFVSFAGNLAMALPVAFLLSELFTRGMAEPVASAEQAVYMLGKLHPWQSGTVAFAAIAGVFLFMAGLISGWVDNRNIFAHIPERVARHPVLTAVLGERGARGVADFMDRNLGVLSGNVFLGFALGSLGTVGEILGLPLDIRHIAFASAEFGTALEVLDFHVAFAVIWPVALGVILIGFVNFVVSFGLSLLIALESRSITWVQVRVLLRHLGKSLVSRPLDWFFPPPAAQVGDAKGGGDPV
jgi:site-specific recombinase